MAQAHKYHLNLGSNIGPEHHLVEAIALLRQHGLIEGLSSVWESDAVGSEGPNFLNICVAFSARLDEQDLKWLVLRPIEAELGRTRGGDKNAPRTIDIDIMLVDGEARNIGRWGHAFVVLPMAEMLPDMLHPVTHEPLKIAAKEAQAHTWIVRRPDLLESDSNGPPST
jgi:2-amino-4-hydroxy-6-hydroxymethyldihydropteridine diphosphokinase